MNTDFFNPTFQKRIWPYPKTIKHKENEYFTNFQTYFLNYKNRQLKTFGQHSIYQDMLFAIPESTNHFQIDLKLVQFFEEKENDYQTSLGVYIPEGWNFFLNSGTCLINHSRCFVISKNDLIEQNISISFDKVLDFSNKNKLIVFPATLSNHKRVVEYETNQFVDKKPELGWNALDYEILNRNSLKVFLTANSKELTNFKNLVIEINFSETLNDMSFKGNF